MTEAPHGSTPAACRPRRRSHAAGSRRRWGPGGIGRPAGRYRPAAAGTARARRLTWWGLLTGVAARRSAVAAGRAWLDTKAAVDGGAEGLLAGIVEQVEAHPVGRVGVAEAQVGAGEAECAAGALRAERAVAGPEGKGGAGLEEAGGVSDVGVPDQVAPAVGWRHGPGMQQQPHP